MPQYDTYDVIIVGSGSGGAALAGRLAEKGINPKTGDRLRIALLEGGSYIFKGGKMAPGLGDAQRRKMITNVIYDETKLEQWPYDGMQNRMVGGCSVHWGGNSYFPFPEDYKLYQEETDLKDWTQQNFKEAVEEVRQWYHVHPMPEEYLNKGNRMVRDVALALGYKPDSASMARKNCLNCGFCGGGNLCKYDAKGTALPYIQLAEEHGVNLIPSAEVKKVIIEKQGAGGIARGVVYEKGGQLQEARADKIIVACGTTGTPWLLYKSGYGPRELLGDNTIVENKNVGKNLDGDVSFSPQALFPEDIKEADRGGVADIEFVLDTPRIRNGVQIFGYDMSGFCHFNYPWAIALNQFAPEFGWEHKNFMRKGTRRIGALTVRVQGLEWSKGHVSKEGRHVYDRTHPAVIKSVLRGREVVLEMFNRMNPKPLKVDTRVPKTFEISHEVGTCRIGKRPESSVVNEQFESHEVKNLIIGSGAVVPKSGHSHSAIPIAVVAAFEWRSLVRNFFSRGA